MEKTNAPDLKKHRGGCHCGALRFEVEADLSAPASRCNCTLCTKLGATGMCVKPEAFVLLSSEAELGTYEWGFKTARRFFCKSCGINAYGRGYLEVLGGHYVSVNLNCLDDIEPRDLKLVHWDGRHNNWQSGPRETPWPVAPAADAVPMQALG
jgi:hypothetical protein